MTLQASGCRVQGQGSRAAFKRIMLTYGRHGQTMARGGQRSRSSLGETHLRRASHPSGFTDSHHAGVPSSHENATPWDPTVGPFLEPCGRPAGGGACSCEQGTPVYRLTLRSIPNRGTCLEHRLRSLLLLAEGITADHPQKETHPSHEFDEAFSEGNARSCWFRSALQEYLDHKKHPPP